ncbi:hypothetical protein MKY29_05305 [Psychrobacillus sp. FSL K6-2365]|uniref:hypothetical protein n=1 Tax=Psychrobacillus sp. FSL K6-2365 TaxID=2921546 RepID=UPI0030F89FBC
MKILLQEKSIEFAQTPSIAEIIENMNELLQDNFYYSHIIVDGEDIVEDPEIFLEKNIGEITMIEIIAITAKDFINNLLLSSEEYTKRAISHMTLLTDNFYNNPSATNWRDLGELLEGIDWMLSMIKTIDQSIMRPANWNEVLTKTAALQQEFKQFEEAIENNDTVLIADILKYEIQPTFKSFAVIITTAIDSKGKRHDLS